MVEQTARKLAEELINSEYGQAFITAKKAYDEDLEAQKMVQDLIAAGGIIEYVQDYVNKQNAFQNRLGNEDVPDEDKDAFYEEINALNTAIRERGTSGALYKAESDFNEYTQSVFNIIMTALQNTLTPESAGGCGGGCSTCSGCH